MKYEKAIKQVFEKFNPQEHGGCVIATRWLIEQHSELKEETVLIKNGEGKIRHTVAITPEGEIIDTQVWQFGLIMPIDESQITKGIYTREEHEKLLPRFTWDEQELRSIAYEVAEEEELPKIRSITFRNNIAGSKRGGLCTRFWGRTEYKIHVNLFKPRYIEDVEGVWKDKNGKKWTKTHKGLPRDVGTITRILAHELAHTKHWNHKAGHKLYTKELISLMNKKYFGGNIKWKNK